MNNRKTQQTKAPINKEAFKMLAMEIGLNAACRRLGVPINTGKSWSHRGGWDLPKRPGGRPQRTIEATSLHPVADILVASHKELEERTRSGLACATVRAAEAAATADQPLPVTNTAHLRDLAAAAARAFGWDGNKQQGRDTYNTLVISSEMIERIRAAADESDIGQAPQLEGAMILTGSGEDTGSDAALESG